MSDALKNKVVVVTGAARGIGNSVVRALLDRGSSVVAIDRRWGDDTPSWSMLQQHPQALMLEVDIERSDDLKSACVAAIERFGRVDVLINNAAMRQRDLFPADGACSVLDTTPDQWQRMFAVNVIAQVEVIKAFVVPMLSAKSGNIINVSAKGGVNYTGERGWWSMPRHLRLNQPYDASKAALSNMSFYLAEELKEQGVAVNVVFPGAIRTTGGDSLEAGRRLRGIDMPLGQPEDVVPAILFLAACQGTSITGLALDATRFDGAGPSTQTSVPS